MSQDLDHTAWFRNIVIIQYHGISILYHHSTVLLENDFCKK